jgi:predicted nucleic acid-binding protein
MGQIVLADASPIIYLAKLEGGISWLKELYARVAVTPVVHRELLPAREVAGKREIELGFRAGTLYEIETPWRTPRFADLDAGEESTIRAAVNLLREGNSCLILIDDKRARRALTTLRSQSLEVSGTAALIGRIKQRGMIESAAEQFDNLLALGFRLGDDIVRAILDNLGEGSPPPPTIAKPRIPRRTAKRRR